MIRVNELSKDYGSRRALDGLTFEARQGEVVGFLGPNGAGKTTTMRILTAYMPPTAGEAIVAGYDVVTESLEVRKRIGYLPETVPLYQDMVVSDYLKFMADLRRLPNADERVGEALEQVGMGDRAHGYIGNLSKGMRQRIGLAQALIHRPEVLILDEPTIGLDPSQVVEIRNLIREIGRERTVLLSTHILSEAQQVCDRVIIINKGRIIAEDTPESLQSRLVGAERVALRVGGDADGLAAKVEKVRGVQQVQSRPDGSLEFQFLPAQDARPLVAKTVVEAGYDLLEMRPIGLSLEEIFLQLTRENQPDIGESKKQKARS
ncbi:MAG: ATP-binding cassette domain-containing protein [Anaerolineae bacterium CFX3]|jgi:ABC-2 type transport system ATP-binding protein|nr:Vitamin B12 import ATP-binding protein BtuD [Anaerolineales bacterium]MCC7512155.1 ATP-binding cassette domain-containing protein [Anaerolineae bacterium]MCE7905005.1 ATP-binding cassette domain-containing protein [Anaerolineae bacterium CFX3]OQY86078.1 MAG: MFS transporter [Anaerolineae bacterium UTCFX3]MBW7919439.1 ATP-binding cassette domain-containing protein [Anaerolineales bacterium]